MLWEQLGPLNWIALVAVIAGGVGNLAKRLRPSMPPSSLPWVVLLAGYLVMLADQMAGGGAVRDAAVTALAGILSAGSAIGGHELIKKTLTPLLGKKRTESLLGKLKAKARKQRRPKK